MPQHAGEDARISRIFDQLLSKVKAPVAPGRPLGEVRLTNRFQCACITKDGRQCRNFVVVGIGDGRCSTHRRGAS